MSPVDDPYAGFPPGFFARTDESDDAIFYEPSRLVTHIDDRAIAALGPLYTELAGTGDLLDLMSSWISHLEQQPRSLTALGMNADELERNPMATQRIVHDLNADPILPFEDASFDGAVCTVSVDYLVRPIEVFAEVARVLRPGAGFVTTFSNRCFPTKAIHGWLATDDAGHVDVVAEYFRRAGRWDEPEVRTVLEPGAGSDPLWAVFASTRSAS